MATAVLAELGGQRFDSVGPTRQQSDPVILGSKGTGGGRTNAGRRPRE
jgi:hypothetical protein